LTPQEKVEKLEETERKLKEKLKQFEVIMTAQPISKENSSKHAPTTFLFMMLLGEL